MTLRGEKVRMMAENEQEQYDEIRRRIEKRYKKRQDLITHAISYVLVNAMLWYFFGHDGWVLWVTFGWGIGLVTNVFDYYSKYGPGAQRREDEIQRAIERERERVLMYEKPKHEPQMRLTDDGELEEIVYDDSSVSEKSKRN